MRLGLVALGLIGVAVVTSLPIWRAGDREHVPLWLGLIDKKAVLQQEHVTAATAIRRWEAFRQRYEGQVPA